jgi:hypothetical protein
VSIVYEGKPQGLCNQVTRFPVEDSELLILDGGAKNHSDASCM